MWLKSPFDLSVLYMTSSGAPGPHTHKLQEGQCPDTAAWVVLVLVVGGADTLIGLTRSEIYMWGHFLLS